MDTTYLKLVAAARVVNHIGLQMDSGVPYKYGPNYLYIEVPVRITGEMEVKRGQHVFVPAAAKCTPKGRHIVEIEPNKELAEFGQIQPGYKLHPDTGEYNLGFYFTAHKNVDLSTLSHCVRVYLVL